MEDDALRKNVLIVDSDARVCRLLRRIAERKGLQAEILSDLEQLPNHASLSAADCIVLGVEKYRLNTMTVKLFARLHNRPDIVLLNIPDRYMADSLVDAAESFGLRVLTAHLHPIDAGAMEDVFETVGRSETVSPFPASSV